MPSNVTTQGNISSRGLLHNHSLANLSTEAETCPRSHNAAASRNTGDNSTPKAINSDAENKGDPTNEVAIRETTLSATSEPTSWDVDASVRKTGSTDCVG